MNGGWLGVFIAPTTKVAVGRGCSRWAHRIVRCTTGHCPVCQPRHPTVRVRPLELLTSGPPDSHCSLSGAPFVACPDFCRRPLALCSCYSAGAPDSPVNYSGVAPRISEGEQFGVGFPGAPDSPVRQPGHTSIVFCSLCLNPFLVFLLVCCEPLSHVKLII